MKKLILILFTICLFSTNSFAIHSYIKTNYIDPLSFYPPTGSTSVLDIYHNIADGNIIIIISDNSAPHYGSLIYAYNTSNEVSRDKAKMFLSQLLYVKINELEVKFIRGTSSNFEVTGIKY